jgi:NAD(P)H-dependent FMN reductase
VIREKAMPETGQKRILGLVGSSRRLGNSELFIKEVSRHVPEAHVLHLVRLPALDIKPCQACYSCIMGGACPVDDHMLFLRDQILEADGLIVAAPVYFLGAHSIIKRILDRGFLFYADATRNAHKPCILVSLYGIDEKLGVTSQALRALAATLCLDLKASVGLKAALPGEVLADPRSVGLAEELGSLMFSGRTVCAPDGCPFCGCDIVRMRGGNEFVCTLCHGSFTLSAKGIPIKGEAGWPIGTVEFIQEHSAWLRGMREKYVTNRKELLRLSLPYKDIGTWVEPPKSSVEC